MLALQVTDSGHIRVNEGEMVIEGVMPSDGGLYSCMAVSASGNASRDVAVHSKILVLMSASLFAGGLQTLLKCVGLYSVFS